MSLEDDLLRRDEVWFVEKDPRGGSRLISEVEYKPIPGVSRQRAYLDGMYGGVPRIAARRFHHIDRPNGNGTGDALPMKEQAESTAEAR